MELLRELYDNEIKLCFSFSKRFSRISWMCGIKIDHKKVLEWGWTSFSAHFVKLFLQSYLIDNSTYLIYYIIELFWTKTAFVRNSHLCKRGKISKEKRFLHGITKYFSNYNKIFSYYFILIKEVVKQRCQYHCE